MTTRASALRGGFVKSYGCQMNVYDSSRISGLLEDDGLSPVAAPADAEVIILNTCHIREKAAEKVFSELGQIRELKESRAAHGEKVLVGVAGCVAQAEGTEILRREPAVDFVLGPQSYHRLPEALGKARAGERAVLIDFETEEKFKGLRQPASRSEARSTSAFVTVQEGCDKFCSFCVVPYTRGAEISRAAPDIFDEVERLARGGVREVTLLGQNVNAYRWRDTGRIWTLADLFRRLSDVPGIERLRYTTSHPLDMSDDLIAAHRELPKLMPYLHLPVQSGSDRVLRAMNRRHTAREYLSWVEAIRASRPDIALSSDFIVGFPGETQDDFEATLALVREVRFASAFSFKYSQRAGTPGAERTDQVPESVKKARLSQLQDLLESQRVQFNQNCVGRSLDVLFEKPGRHAGQIVGRSPYLQSVYVNAPASMIGSIQKVHVEQLGSNSLAGRVAGPAYFERDNA